MKLARENSMLVSSGMSTQHLDIVFEILTETYRLSGTDAGRDDPAISDHVTDSPLQEVLLDACYRDMMLAADRTSWAPVKMEITLLMNM
jgi:hypothetical protein